MKFKSLLLLLVLMFSFIGSINAEENIQVYINGEKQSYSQSPFIEHGTTLVPMRAIFESLGASVEWNGEEKTVTGSKGNKEVVLTIGSKSTKVNGKNVSIDVPANIYNGSTFVPLRFISESLGEKVSWNGNERSIYIGNTEISTTTNNDYKDTISNLDYIHKMKSHSEIYLKMTEDVVNNSELTDTGKESLINGLQKMLNEARNITPATDYRTGHNKYLNKLESTIVRIKNEMPTTLKTKADVEKFTQSFNYSFEPLKILLDVINEQNNVSNTINTDYTGDQEPKTETGSIKGNVTWQYNDFIGTKPDVGAKVFLIPTSFNDKDYTFSDIKSYAILGDIPEGSNLQFVTVDGYGNYEINDIPIGEYFVVISSKNTMRSESERVWHKPTLSMILGYEGFQEFERVNLDLYKSLIKKIEIKKNDTLNLNHDFGFTNIR